MKIAAKVEIDPLTYLFPYSYPHPRTCTYLSTYLLHIIFHRLRHQQKLSRSVWTASIQHNRCGVNFCFKPFRSYFFLFSRSHFELVFGEFRIAFSDGGSSFVIEGLRLLFVWMIASKTWTFSYGSVCIVWLNTNIRYISLEKRKKKPTNPRQQNDLSICTFVGFLLYRSPKSSDQQS